MISPEYRRSLKVIGVRPDPVEPRNHIVTLEIKEAVGLFLISFIRYTREYTGEGTVFRDIETGASSIDTDTACYEAVWAFERRNKENADV